MNYLPASKVLKRSKFSQAANIPVRSLLLPTTNSGWKVPATQLMGNSAGAGKESIFPIKIPYRTFTAEKPDGDEEKRPKM